MSGKSNIEWTRSDDGTKGSTWNPLVGCTKVSDGCKNCYAMTMAARIANAAQAALRSGRELTDIQQAYSRVVKWKRGGMFAADEHDVAMPAWNNRVELIESVLLHPLRWQKPRRIFVNSMSDLFHESVPFEFIDKAFAIVAMCPQHTFQVLTKRPERMRKYLTERELNKGFIPTRKGGDGDLYRNAFSKVYRACEAFGPQVGRLSPDDEPGRPGWAPQTWPLPNVWLGTSVEDQKTADARHHHLAALYDLGYTTFWSAEPLLGPISISDACYAGSRLPQSEGLGLSWIIAGGETQTGARPMHPDWPRGLRDQCKANGIPFFFKQWGDWWPFFARDDDALDQFEFADGVTCVSEHGDPPKSVASSPDASKPNVHQWPHYNWGGELQPEEYASTIDDDGYRHFSIRVGKYEADNILDGQLHYAYPELLTANAGGQA